MIPSWWCSTLDIRIVPTVTQYKHKKKANPYFLSQLCTYYERVLCAILLPVNWEPYWNNVSANKNNGTKPGVQYHRWLAENKKDSVELAFSSTTAHHDYLYGARPSGQNRKSAFAVVPKLFLTDEKPLDMRKRRISDKCQWWDSWCVTIEKQNLIQLHCVTLCKIPIFRISRLPHGFFMYTFSQEPTGRVHDGVFCYLLIAYATQSFVTG